MFKTSFFTKTFILISVAGHSFPSKWSCPPTNGFSQFFQHKLKNIRKVFLLESIAVVTKKPPMYRNFALSFYCMNGSMRADAPIIKIPLCVIPISSLEVYYWSFSK